MKVAPIIIFAYNRPDHLMLTIEALAKCDLSAQSKIIVILDGPKNDRDIAKQHKIKELLNTVSGFAELEVRFREENIGLEQNISNGITSVMAEYGRAIVLEDDILVSPAFLRFMNEALEFYNEKKQVWHISGWNFPITQTGLPSCFLWRTALGWGWATWADRWKYYKRDPQSLIQRWDQINIEGFNLYGAYDFWDQVVKNASGQLRTWAVFWYSTIFEHGGLCLNPIRAMTSNIGFDGTGTHHASSEFTLTYDPEFDYTKDGFPMPTTENREVVGKIIEYNKQLQIEKCKAKNQTNKDLKKLVQIALTEEYDFPDFKGKRIAIFGIADLSLTVYRLLFEKNIKVCAFFVSKPTLNADIGGVPVLVPPQWLQLSPDIIINCIEGIHENSVSNMLLKALPTSRVISWRTL